MKRKRRTDVAEEPEPIRSPDTDVESFGPWLRRQREVRGIDPREVADASKISVRYIEALETNRFEVLPAEVFTKGFLRQYAVYVGLDPEEVVNYYLAALQARRAAEDPDPDLHPRPRSRRSGAAWIWWLLALGLVAGAAAWWWLGGTLPGWLSSSSSTTDSSAVAPSAEASEPEARETATVDPVASSDEPAGGGDEVAMNPGEVAGASPSSTPTTEAAQVPTPPVDSSPTDVPTDGSFVVVADFSGDCWVEAVMDETRRLEQMRVQGESLRLEARSTIDLKLGDARVVQVEVNGMPLRLSPSGNSSVVNLRIDAETVAALRAAGSGAE